MASDEQRVRTMAGWIGVEPDSPMDLCLRPAAGLMHTELQGVRAGETARGQDWTQ